MEDGTRLTVRIFARDQQLRGRRAQVTDYPRVSLEHAYGCIELFLDVRDVVALEPPPQDWMAPLRSVGAQRQAAWSAIEQSIEGRIRAGEHPRVLMLVSRMSEAEADVDGMLEAHTGVYQLNKREVRLSSPEAVAQALAVQQGDADLVAVVGGGVSSSQLYLTVASSTPWCKCPSRSSQRWVTPPITRSSNSSSIRRFRRQPSLGYGSSIEQQRPSPRLMPSRRNPRFKTHKSGFGHYNTAILYSSLRSAF